LLIPPVGSPGKANSFWANSFAALSYSFLLTILSISDKVVSYGSNYNSYSWAKSDSSPSN
jgi:hypothetical protein